MTAIGMPENTDYQYSDMGGVGGWGGELERRDAEHAATVIGSG